MLKEKAVREQVPLTIATASTLYTLQGATTTPGMIYHFRTPRRCSAVMKWIATYMALSRVQSLKELRSIGIQPDVLVCRSDRPIGDEMKRKIGGFCGVLTRFQACPGCVLCPLRAF